MIDAFTATQKIDKECSNDYVLKCVKIKYKDDKYKREKETTIDTTFPPTYVRFAYKFDKDEQVLDSIKLNELYRFLPLPYIPLASEEDRTCVYVVGASGAGKSYLVNKMAQEYKQQFPKNKIYYLTRNNAAIDRSLDKSLYIYVDIDKYIDYYIQDGKIKEFMIDSKKRYFNSMFIFDDIGIGSVGGVNKEQIQREKILDRIRDIILENKRKFQMSIIIISHASTNYTQTRLILTEMKQYILFIKSLKTSSDRVLLEYLNLSQTEVNNIVNEISQTSDWILVDNIRRIIATAREVFFLKNKKLEIADVDNLLGRTSDNMLASKSSSLAKKRTGKKSKSSVVEIDN